MNDNRKGGGGNVDDDNSFDEVIIGGRNAVLKVERDDNFAIQSNVNRWLKYGIFSLSYLFLLFSIGLFALGIWAQMAKSGVLVDLKKFDSKNVVLFLEPTALITVIAIIIVIISFCGAIGSLRDNCFYLMVYECMLGCLIITYLMLIVTTIFNGFVLLRVIEITIEDIIILYRDEPDLQLLVDWIQINFKCCGVHSPHDWNNNIYFSDISMLDAYGSSEAGSVPFSCCKGTTATTSSLANTHCGLNARKPPPSQKTRRFLREDIHESGCVEMIKRFLMSNILYIALALFILFLIQLLSLISSRILQNQIFQQCKNWYSTRRLKVSVYN